MMQSRITDFRSVEVGDHVEIPASRSLVGAELPEPIWLALLVAPQKERAARERLRSQDGVFAFYPERKIHKVRNGQTISRTFPVVSQIVYALFHRHPQFDVMRDQGLIRGVFCRGNRPIILPTTIVKSIQGLAVAWDELQEAKTQLRRGDRVEIIEGPLAGFMVDVERSVAGRVWWSTALGMKGEIGISAVRKDGE